MYELDYLETKLFLPIYEVLFDELFIVKCPIIDDYGNAFFLYTLITSAG